MYERLIQKLINRNVGAIAGTLRPTDGWTACTIYTGGFPNTYDGRTTTTCCFHTDQGTCLCEWYWDTPVNVTKFNMYTLNYPLNSDIYRIWGRVDGSWVELWAGTWIPSYGVWSSKAISCNNCDGIRIGQRLGSQHAVACINEVSVDYEEVVVEGEATIVSTGEPSTFTPNVEFRIRPTLTNVGGDDTLFVTLTNTDTGAVLKELEVFVLSGKNWVPSMYVTLTQTTDFHGRLEAGHIE